ncbi:hypothetical protein PRK78_001967 [Emydomyces testavorans]|uniref:Uncharacterized protein n=1 Tax=Emydomyces testavorans TaxID=2070801 RepID=A0AAF0DDD8_9EURO|nr:hypothetical protein PRK78_001967 [Emydomyces testavorans]
MQGRWVGFLLDLRFTGIQELFVYSKQSQGPSTIHDSRMFAIANQKGGIGSQLGRHPSPKSGGRSVSLEIFPKASTEEIWKFRGKSAARSHSSLLFPLQDSPWGQMGSQSE